jgi:DNA-binding transcriptional MerR regulator
MAVQIKEQELTIQQMVEATGLSAHTLRYYERAGLMLPQVERDEGNGYRAYTMEHVRWIAFIKRLRTTGMPIRDIQRYTELLREGDLTMLERMQLLKGHRMRVEERLHEEQQHLDAINTKIAYYEEQMTNQTFIPCEDEFVSR